MDAEQLYVYQRAMTLAVSQRRDVQAQITELEHQLADLRVKERALNELVHAWHALAPSDDVTTQVVDDGVVVPLHEDAEQWEEPAVDTGEAEVPSLPQPPGLTRKVASTSSPYRVGVILLEAGKPMTRADIIREYTERGWVEDDWKDANANISQAIRRAVKYGWAENVPNEKWTLVSTQAPGGHTVAGDVDDEGWSTL